MRQRVRSRTFIVELMLILLVGKTQVKKGKVVERDATGQIVRQTMAKSAGVSVRVGRRHAV